MNKHVWRTLTALVVLIVLASFFWLFKDQQIKPTFLHLPYILWVSILQTTLLVVLTYLGSKFFPFKEQHKP